MERNVVFNEEDVLTTNNIAIIPGDALADGERDKIIQNPTNNANSDETNINQPEAEAEKLTHHLVLNQPVLSHSHLNHNQQTNQKKYQLKKTNLHI